MRHLRITLAVAVLAGGFSLLGFANPDCAYACSCFQPKSIAEYANEPDALILKGTVTAYDANSQRGQFHVERWYQGSSEVADIPIRGGNGADCGLFLAAGQELVMVASASDGILVPSICSPSGDLSTPEGRQMDADAVAAYGEGTKPGGEEAPTGSTDDLAIPWIVPIAVGAVAVFVGFIALASFVSGRRGA